MADFVVVSDYVVVINNCSIGICMCLLMFIYVDDDTAVNMPYNNNYNMIEKNNPPTKLSIISKFFNDDHQ